MSYIASRIPAKFLSVILKYFFNWICYFLSNYIHLQEEPIPHPTDMENNSQHRFAQLPTEYRLPTQLFFFEIYVFACNLQQLQNLSYKLFLTMTIVHILDNDGCSKFRWRRCITLHAASSYIITATTNYSSIDQAPHGILHSYHGIWSGARENYQKFLVSFKIRQRKHAEQRFWNFSHCGHRRNLYFLLWYMCICVFFPFPTVLHLCTLNSILVITYPRKRGA